MSRKIRSLVVGVLAGLAFVLLFNLFQAPSDHSGPPPLTYSQFREVVAANGVPHVVIQGDQVRGELKDGKEFVTTVPLSDQSL